MKNWKYGIVATLLLMIGASCEKDVTDLMEQFYVESEGLSCVKLDSINRFEMKVTNYVNLYPEEKEHPLYVPIQENIKNALNIFNIQINDEWSDTIYVSY